MMYLNLIFSYVVIGLCLGIFHITSLKSLFSLLLEKKKFYEGMVEMQGTSPSGAEYFILLQELVIDNKNTFDEMKAMEKNSFKWHFQMIAPFLIVWPYLLFFEYKNKQR